MQLLRRLRLSLNKRRCCRIRVTVWVSQRHCQKHCTSHWGVEAHSFHTPPLKNSRRENKREQQERGRERERERERYIYIYVIYKHTHIYIYMAITSISGPKQGQNFNFPHFYSKNDPEKNPHQVWGFSLFNVFSSFSSLPFLALFFRLSLLFLTFRSLKVAHQMRL